MAEEPEKSGQEPNLELPSLLGFGRRKKRRQGDAVPEEPVADAQPAAPEPPADSESTGPLAADPVSEPRGGLAPAADRAKRLPPVPPPPRAQAAPAGQVSSPPPAEPEPTEPAEPEVVHETPVVDEPAVVEAPPVVEARVAETPTVVTPPPPRAEPVSEPASDPTSAVEETSVLPDGLGTPPLADEPVEDHEEPLGWPEEDPEEPETDPDTAVGPVGQAPGSRRAGRTSRSLSLPVINPRLAAALTGALVGLSGVLLAFVSQRGCELVRGVGSCGGIGLLALLVILALEVMIGAVLLKAWRLSDPASTSFLGVGLMAVFVLLFLLSSLESVWMLLVIPVVSALTFLVSWWVTATFVEGVQDDRFSR